MELDYEVGIVGAGFAGIIAALTLQKSGRHSFVLWERGSEIGGTWRDNIYPGCACDVAVHLYSIAANPNPEWNYLYARQPEILQYLKGVTEQHHLQKHIRLHTEITKALFVKDGGYWKVTDGKGYSSRVRVLLLALGPLNRPNIPALKGLESFKGKWFHSSAWDYSYDLKGKNVAVIGTGASAVQFIPEIAPLVKHLTIFQRSAAWVVDRRDKPISRFQKWLYKKFPMVQKIAREKIYWLNELFGLSFLGNKLLRRIAAGVAMRKLKREVAGTEIRKKLLPHYTIGCKRILKSDDYYPTFNRSNVSLITENIQEITSNIIIANSNEHPVDAIIFGTGFIAADINVHTKIIGLDGQNLIEGWKEEGAEAYLGTAVSGYPNLLFILGPNTGLGHNSVVHMMESQMAYLLPYLQLLEENGAGAYINVKKEIQQQYNKELQAKLSRTVWASGCRSWYLNAKGKNTTIYPGLTIQFRKRMKRFNKNDYTIVQQQIQKEAKASVPVN